jgi:hypothetical protein
VQKGNTPNVFLAVGADWQENSLPKRRKSVAYSTYNAYLILFVYYRTVPRFPLWVPMTHVPYRCHVVTHHTSILLTLVHSHTHIDKVASFPVSNTINTLQSAPEAFPSGPGTLDFSNCASSCLRNKTFTMWFSNRGPAGAKREDARGVSLNGCC